jgi:hypothetical protein
VNSAMRLRVTSADQRWVHEPGNNSSDIKDDRLWSACQAWVWNRGLLGGCEWSNQGSNQDNTAF